MGELHIWGRGGGGHTSGDRGDVVTYCPLVAAGGDCTLPLPEMGKLRHDPNPYTPSSFPGGAIPSPPPPHLVPSVLLVPVH